MNTRKHSFESLESRTLLAGLELPVEGVRPARQRSFTISWPAEEVSVPLANTSQVVARAGAVEQAPATKLAQVPAVTGLAGAQVALGNVPAVESRTVPAAYGDTLGAVKVIGKGVENKPIVIRLGEGLEQPPSTSGPGVKAAPQTLVDRLRSVEAPLSSAQSVKLDAAVNAVLHDIAPSKYAAPTQAAPRKQTDTLRRMEAPSDEIKRFDPVFYEQLRVGTINYNQMQDVVEAHLKNDQKSAIDSFWVQYGKTYGTSGEAARSYDLTKLSEQDLREYARVVALKTYVI